MKIIVLLPLVLALPACSKSEAGTSAKPVPEATAVSRPAPAAASPPAPAEPTPVEKILKLESLAEAVTFAKPMMDDTDNEVSAGSAILAAWGAKRMRWVDVVVAPDETSFAKVQKDADDERGKRLCVGGSVIQIAVAKTSFGKFYEGLLMTPAQNIFRFTAVGSSGSLVERSAARVCGVVTGKYDYSNSGGGKGHAVNVVGMFDLPENRKATPL